VHEWAKLSSSSTAWAVNLIQQGHELEWEDSPPPPNARMEEHASTAAAHAKLATEVQKLLDAGAIRRSSCREVRLWQRLFAVPKKPDKIRPIWDCRPLNGFLKKEHFKMEGWGDVETLLRPGDWLTRLDLTSAYLHVPMATSAQPYLGFRFGGQTFICRALPFGLSSSPRTFTKLMRVVVTEMRAMGLRVVVYLDDLLLLASSHEESLAQTRRALDLLERLGFSVNYEKSQTTPTQSLTFLGFVLDSVSMTLGMREDKLNAVLHAISVLMEVQRLSARKLSKALGLIGSMRPVVEDLHLHTLHLSRCVARTVRRGGWGMSTSLSEGARCELRWLLDNLHGKTTRSMVQSMPTVRMRTDACPTGWGAVLYPQQEGPPSRCKAWAHWLASEASSHINVLETRACTKGLQAFAASVRGQTLRWESDNNVAVFSVKKWKSRKLSMRAALEELRETCRQLGVTLQAEHIPGTENTEADELSRRSDREDWKLNPLLFRKAQRLFGYWATVDAFASSNNCQIPRFWSFGPQPGTAGIDALCQDWRGELPWCNPPFSLVGRVLALLCTQRARALLCYPCWPSQPWWPTLQEMLVARPWILPRQRTTFLPGLLGSTVPAGWAKWTAAVALVSGNPDDFPPR